MAGTHTRVIPAGGTITIGPCRLARVEENGSFTDENSRTFAGAPTTGSDWGEGTAPAIAGRLTATVETIAHFKFA